MHINLTSLLCIVVFASSAIAQEQNKSVEPQINYLLNDSGTGGLEFSTFYGEIAPSTAFANLNNTLGKVFMTEFGLHLNRKFAIGFYSARSNKTNVINVPAQSDSEYQEWIDAGVELNQLPTGATQAFAYFSHTGLNLAYMHNTEKIIFWRAGFRIGSGKLQLTAEKKQLFDFYNVSIFEEKVLNINPEIGLGVNLRRWWRLHLDLGYHFIFGGSNAVIDAGKFDGTTFKFGFAFGDFSK